MKFYEIVNMYNLHFDRRFYFENKTTFIEFLLFSSLVIVARTLLVRLDTVR